ncbi:MAG: transcription elongation factor Elf1 [Oleispira sp.]|jgi:transcription elongation factor Elf1
MDSHAKHKSKCIVYVLISGLGIMQYNVLRKLGVLKKVNALTEKSIVCPYCGEILEVLIDLTDVNEQYIEDCQVCCKPINFIVSEDNNGEVTVSVYSDDDTF